MWIGVLTDSAGAVTPRLLEVFDGVDYILHCGNIGELRLLDELSQLAPVAGVLGPNDGTEDLPFEKTLFRKWFDVGIYVTYRLGDPNRLAKATLQEFERLDPEVILFGKNEGAFNARVENRLYFNPGPSARRRAKSTPSVGILEIEGRLVRGEIVPLDEK